MKAELGRLVRVSPRLCWTGEAPDFVGWLAKQRNISLLSEAIDLDLEVETPQDGVQPFHTEILCRDTATGRRVLIDSQLEPTNHLHLGHLLTRAASLNVQVIVWIAEQFTDEYRATLDWLNQITRDQIRFFGLEVELWQIDNSPLAPRFNVVSRPAGWSRTEPHAADRLRRPAVIESAQLMSEYWSAFQVVLEQRTSPIKLDSPAPRPWCTFTSDSSDIHLFAAVDARDRRITAGLLLNGPDAKILFERLQEERQAIEHALGVPLDWRAFPGKNQSHIVLTKHSDPQDHAQWNMQHTWLVFALEGLRKVFAARITTLRTASLPARAATGDGASVE